MRIEGRVTFDVQYLWGNNFRNCVQYSLPLVLLFLCALLLTVDGRVCTVLLSCVYCCYLLCIVVLYVYCCPIYTYLSDCSLDVSIRKVPATGHLGRGFYWFPCVCL